MMINYIVVTRSTILVLPYYVSVFIRANRADVIKLTWHSYVLIICIHLPIVRGLVPILSISTPLR
jgi:hypothetical protein